MNCKNQLFFKYLIQEGFEEITSKLHKQSYFRIIDGKYNPTSDLRTFIRKDITFFFDLTCLMVKKGNRLIKAHYIYNPFEQKFIDIPASILSIVSAPNRYISKEVRQYILESFGNKCVHCGSSDRLEIDHINPVSLGGSNATDNLQVLCKPCNVKKSNKIPQ